ncbi:MAG: RNA pseudouridine synthase [bacterium]
MVNKPADWVVHPTNDPAHRDLLAWARELGAPDTIAPIHRLDRETSGVVLLADHPKDQYRLLKAFEAGEVAKTYLALVCGSPRAKGSINKPLDDARRGKPLPATTDYEVAEQIGGWALLRITPKTGRKHQIRRHLHGIGFPIVGDTRYRAKKRTNVPGFPGRLWLHAARLAWNEHVWTAELPEELAAHLALLRDLEETTSTP